MQGYVRYKTRTEAQGRDKFKQKSFTKGENSDLAPSQIGDDQCALLENFIAFPNYLESRSGTKRFSDTALPGSGTIHAFKQHPTSKKFVLHRADLLYVGTSNMSSWTTLYPHGATSSVVTENGDASGQLSGIFLLNTNTSNTDNGTLYWNLTNSGSIRTLNIYKNSGKTQLVATATRSGNGFAHITQQNDSGIRGSVTITYSGDDTDSGNTFEVDTETLYGNIFDVDSMLKPFDNDFVLFLKTNYMVYIDLSNNKLIYLNGDSASGFGSRPVVGSGSQAAATPYGYRYIYTWSRITGGASADRVSGTLVFEGGPNQGFSQAPQDYGEFWVANPITSSNSLTLTVTSDGTMTGSLLAHSAYPHYTHLSLYRTLDIGVAGTDPVSGQGNNREIYAWVDDYDITQPQIVDTMTDAELRARFEAGFGLKNRFWTNLPNGEVGEITNGFLFIGVRGTNRVYYNQLTYKQYIGFYNPAYQFFTLDDGLQLMAQSPDILSIICANRTYTSAYGNTEVVKMVQNVDFVITHLTVSDQTIGVVDWGSFTEMQTGVYLAVCSDRTVRQWNRYSWSSDLSLGAVNKVIQQFILGSTGAYISGAYYLWYRTSAGNSYNDSCLRLGMGGNAGNGWSRMTGSAWIYPPTYIGAVLTLNSSSVQQLIVLDSPGAAFYIVPPFLGHGATLATGFFTDKITTGGSAGTAIAPKVKFKEIVDEENRLLFHEESFLDVRDWTGAGTGPTTATVAIYADGAATAVDSLTYTLPSDLQFFKKVKGARLQLEVTWAATGLQLASYTTTYQAHDSRAIGAAPSDTLEATYQLALASDLKHWLCQPDSNLNRVTGTDYTLAGTAPTQVTGANGKTYALSFVSGASYVQTDTTSYTDFAVCFWCKTVDLNARILILDGAADLYIRFTNNTTMDVSGIGSVTVASIASGFHNFWVTRSSSTITVYQAGASVGTLSNGTAVGGTVTRINDQGGAMILDDIRVYNATKSAAAIAYYYSDIVNNSGKKVLPLG